MKDLIPNLRSCPKTYILDTHRSRAPEDTLMFVEDMKIALGMEDFRDATTVDRIGLPVFTCSRIRPDGSRTYHTGKGLTTTQAQVSLTMESIERYSSEFRETDQERIIKGSYRELASSRSVLHPDSLILPRFSDFKEDVPYHWTTGFDLADGSPVLVPACCVYHPFHLDDPPLISTSTNGIAAGNTLEEAVFHALMEVIERDAWSIVKYAHFSMDRLFIRPSPENEFLLHIESKLREAEIDLTLYDYTLDLGIPIVAARAYDLVIADLMPMEGFGAHLDPKVACGRAMLETATTRSLLFQQHGVKNLIERPCHYLEPELHGEGYDENQPAKDLRELEIGYSEDILADIELVRERLTKSGLSQIIVVDLTREEIGAPTVRVIVPGMEVYGFDPARIGDRMYRVITGCEAC